MGYNIYITKSKYWCDNKGNEITPSEWLAVIEGDSELRLYKVNGPFYAIWTGASSLVEPSLDLQMGNIVTKHPDAALIEKMVQIAKRIGAKVQGDDDEVYPGDGREPYNDE